MKIGFVSDIHEDIVSLQKAIDLLKSKNCDQIICLGDSIGSASYRSMDYFDTKNARDCVTLIQQECVANLLGNHDYHHIQKTSLLNQVFSFPKNWFELSKEQRQDMANNKVWLYDNDYPTNLTEANISFLRDSKEYHVNDSLFFSHYLFPDISGDTKKFHKKYHKIAVHFDWMKKENCTIGFVGHEHPHFPKILSKDGKTNNIEWNTPTIIKANQVVVCPAVCQQQKKSQGVLIFDTKTNEALGLKINP